ncbi:endonuclease-reverse transcriptase [Elysia marginata]|uniref:Endonuclease-reverse transcriptase n=1 Tax=Elysia marginata TaxID=1093978 RepID=A0AAV4FRM3_9GAST|nr:endonuclease-reverse transcriptase [Elysia marginata]
MKKFQMPIRYDASNISKEYCIEVSNKFEALNAATEEIRPEELANKAKEIFTEASKHLKTKQQKKQKWLSDEALQKMQERRMAKSKGLHHEDYKKKVREVKQIIRRDKKKYTEDKCEQIENNFSKKNRSRDAYNIIKNLTKTFQPKSIVIKDENGNVLTESGQILDRWKRYSENMFANTSEPKQTAVDNKERYTDTELEPLRSEVEWATNSLKDRKSPGCDEITA